MINYSLSSNSQAVSFHILFSSCCPNSLFPLTFLLCLSNHNPTMSLKSQSRGAWVVQLVMTDSWFRLSLWSQGCETEPCMLLPISSSVWTYTLWKKKFQSIGCSPASAFREEISSFVPQSFLKSRSCWLFLYSYILLTSVCPINW